MMEAWNKSKHFMNILNECFVKSNVNYHALTIDDLKSNEELLEQALEITMDCFLTYGLRDDYEPNAFGIELESLIDFLLRLK